MVHVQSCGNKDDVFKHKVIFFQMCYCTSRFSKTTNVSLYLTCYHVNADV